MKLAISKFSGRIGYYRASCLKPHVLVDWAHPVVRDGSVVSASVCHVLDVPETTNLVRLHDAVKMYLALGGDPLDIPTNFGITDQDEGD